MFFIVIFSEKNENFMQMRNTYLMKVIQFF